VIRRVKLKNFTCHELTELELPEGLIVFIGRNGAGKSSVIDAITYALYGEHSRGNNANIVRDGASEGEVELEFHLRGNKYLVLRRFNSRGALEHSFLKCNGKTLATGERRREDDDVVQQIRKILGLDYEEMVSAVIIRQGELDSILSEEPKELKELFDKLVGLEKMEEAYERMRDVIDDFRNKVRESVGWDLKDLERVEETLGKKRQELEDRLRRCEQLEKEVAELKSKLEEERRKYSELKEVKEMYDTARNLLSVLKYRLNQREKELETSIRTLKECRTLLEHKDVVDRRTAEREALKEVQKRKEEELRRIEGEAEGIEASLRELRVPGVPPEKAPTLQTLKDEAVRRAEKLRDDSIELGKRLARRESTEELEEEVSRGIAGIVDLVSESYRAGGAQAMTEMIEKRERLSGELDRKRKQIEDLRGELERIRREMEGLSYIEGKHVDELRDKIRDAERDAEKLGGVGRIPELEEELTTVRNALSWLSQAEDRRALPEVKDLEGMEKVLGEDGELRQLRTLLEQLRAKPFDVSELERNEKLLNELNRQLGKCEASLRENKAAVERLRDEVEKLERAVRELARAREFHDLLVKIREKIYHRDGPVVKGIRAWALKNVSERAARYLDLFDVRFSDIRLEETREGKGISFVSSYGGRRADSERLSGGERVALALAIRLAISDVLGAGRFGFFILDEPTTHLDSENKRKLREVFTRLGEKVRQVIIITHDEEIFEEADAMIVKFERSPAPNAPTRIHVLHGPAARVTAR